MSDSFWPLYRQLMQGRLVDLTHSFDSAAPCFEPSTPMKITETASYKEQGYLVQQFQFEGQWGTHVDAPAHFCEGSRTVEDIALKEMILPLVVIDIHEQAAQNPDYILPVDDVLSWEDRFGPVPKGAFVALRTDWSKRWPDNAAMHNRDSSGISHTPGWGLDALTYLYNQCMVTATGQETIDPDPGSKAEATNWMCERFILSHNHYQIDLLTHLDQCPPKGAIVFCTFPKPKKASGFPARVFAICPPHS